MHHTLRPLLVLFCILTALTGLIYPLAVTGVGKALFAAQSSGSLVMRGGKLAGSSLIGQSFQEPKYFWGRSSATSPMPNNAAASTGSNLGPTNPALLEAVKARIAQLKAADPQNTQPIPVDLVTASGSGLDPHISPAAALYQAGRVARARHMDPEAVRRLVRQYIEPPQWGIFGEARVNVLLLNLAMDRAQ
ncbi:MAG TPA: potassium-transporting ATPase subunit KdpC [Steroidobacteraceae bacterium]|jgi:K+-transporting ATPase ATPase C chain|nr:potassium-transporting ATPase subunit KdpC [Steroidobacteraceae bacterium]